MPLAFEDDEPRVRNFTRETFGEGAMGLMAGRSMVLVVADQHQSRHLDVLDAMAGIIFLAGDHVAKENIEPRRIAEPNREEALQTLGIFFDEFFGEAESRRVVAHIGS